MEPKPPTSTSPRSDGHPKKRVSTREVPSDTGITPTPRIGVTSARYKQIRLDDHQITQAKILVARGKLWSPDIEKLLRRWESRMGRRQKGHLKMSRRHLKYFYVLGAISTILTAVVASGSLATFRDCGGNSKCVADEWIRLVSAIIAILSGIASGLMMFFNWSGSAEKHKSSSDAYEEMIRNLDSTLRLDVTLRGDALAFLQSIRSTYNDIVRSSPSIPSKYSVDLGYRCLATTDADATSPRNKFEGVPCETRTPRDVVPNNTEVPIEDLSRWHNLADTLAKRVIDEEHQTALAIEEANDYDTDDEKNKDREVVVSFDLDGTPSMDPVEIRRQQLRKSLFNTLAFEMERARGHDRDAELSRVNEMELHPNNAPVMSSTNVEVHLSP